MKLTLICQDCCLWHAMVTLSCNWPLNHCCPSDNFVMPAAMWHSLLTGSLSNTIILQGYRTAITKLWESDIQLAATPTTHKANATVGSATPADLVAFDHAVLFSPALSTLAKALQCRYHPEFASLTLQRLHQHPPQSIAMMQGHMDQEQQHKNSTRPKEDPPLDDNAFPPAPLDGTCIHFCYATMLKPTGQIYTDQTGKFVAPSSTGNNYILILYDYDSNAILAVPFKNQKSESILNAYKIGHARLCAT